MSSPLHLVNFLLMAGASLVPVYIALKVKTRVLQNFSVLLGAFFLIHSFYHLAEFMEGEFIADVFLLPASVFVLDALGVYYLLRGE